MKTFVRTLLILSLALALMPARPAAAVTQALSPNWFGYVYSNPPSGAWVEINSAAPSPGTVVLSPGNSSAPVTLPIDFAFFENTYPANTAITIYTNGLISFGSGDIGKNKPIPTDELPNKLIAPLWTDLSLGTGQVYTKVSTINTTPVFIVEWDGLTRPNVAGTLSFQVVLFASPDYSIEFRYKTIPVGAAAGATTGIEDMDGVDGVPLDAGSITSGSVVRLTYPPAGYRFKAYPAFQSALMTARIADMPVTVKNTCSSTGFSTDNYNITYDSTTLPSGWTATFWKDNLPVTSTGDITFGTNTTLSVRLIAPFAAAVGETAKVSVKFTSTHSGQVVTVTRQAAVSAPFVQGYTDSLAGLKLQAVNPARNFDRSIYPQANQKGASLAWANKYSYVAAWHTGGQPNAVNTRYTLIDLLANTQAVNRVVTENLSGTLDSSASVAVAPNGMIGLAFIRTVQSGISNQNQNVYLALIDNVGSLKQTINLTNNPDNGIIGDVGIHSFSEVSIGATPDNRFTIAWTQMLPAVESGVPVDHQDIFTVVYDAGSVTLPATASAPRALTASNANVDYVAPMLIPLKNASTNMYLMYLAKSLPSGPTNLMGLALDAAGAKATGTVDMVPTAINAGRFDAVQLFDTLNPTVSGKLLAAWIDDTSKTPTFALWNANGTVAKATTPLQPPDNRSMREIAVTLDQYDHGILTWADQQGNRLYYALVNSDGTLRTSPMIMRSADTATLELGSPSNVYSSAFLQDPIKWTLNLPMVKR